MHFKVYQDNMNDTRFDGATGYESSGEDDDEGMHVTLHFHGTCYFEEDENKFRMEEADNTEMFHPQGLHWKWCGKGKNYVQVGNYPPLKIHRLENWGWRLENPQGKSLLYLTNLSFSINDMMLHSCDVDLTDCVVPSPGVLKLFCIISK